MGEDEMAALENAIGRGPAEPSGMMSARAYREKVVKPFLSKILGMTKLVIARAKSCFAELMKVQEELETVKEERDELREKNEHLNVLCKSLDRDNDSLREDSRKLEWFKKYLSTNSYDEIVRKGEREEREKTKI